MWIGCLWLECDCGVESDLGGIVFGYFLQDLSTFVSVNGFDVVLEPFSLCFEVVSGDINVPSAVRICFAGGVDF